MPILNYTTTISPAKTVAEIQAILARHGALQISVDYATGENGAFPAGVSFLIEINGNTVQFRLPSHWAEVRELLERDKDVPKRLKSEEQAIRVAWRIIKNWVEAQFALISYGIAETEEVFMPYAVHRSGQTLFELFRKNPQRLLTNGES